MPQQIVETKHAVESLMFGRDGVLFAIVVVWAGNDQAPGPMSTRRRVVCDPVKGYLTTPTASLGQMSAAAKRHDGQMYRAICDDICQIFESGSLPL